MEKRKKAKRPPPLSSTRHSSAMTQSRAMRPHHLFVLALTSAMLMLGRLALANCDDLDYNIFDVTASNCVTNWSGTPHADSLGGTWYSDLAVQVGGTENVNVVHTNCNSRQGGPPAVKCYAEQTGVGVQSCNNHEALTWTGGASQEPDWNLWVNYTHASQKIRITVMLTVEDGSGNIRFERHFTIFNQDINDLGIVNGEVTLDKHNNIVDVLLPKMTAICDYLGRSTPDFLNAEASIQPAYTYTQTFSSPGVIMLKPFKMKFNGGNDCYALSNACYGKLPFEYSSTGWLAGYFIKFKEIESLNISDSCYAYEPDFGNCPNPDTDDSTYPIKFDPNKLQLTFYNDARFFTNRDTSITPDTLDLSLELWENWDDKITDVSFTVKYTYLECSFTAPTASDPLWSHVTVTMPMSVASDSVTLTAPAVTDNPDGCSPVVYSWVYSASESTYDPFSAGQVTISDNAITFADLASYDPGAVVKGTLYVGYSADTAQNIYFTNFALTIINCNNDQIQSFTTMQQSEITINIDGSNQDRLFTNIMESHISWASSACQPTVYTYTVEHPTLQTYTITVQPDATGAWVADDNSQLFRFWDAVKDKVYSNYEYYSSSDKSIYFGTHTVTVRGGNEVVSPDHSFVFTVEVVNFCAQQGFIHWLDDASSSSKFLTLNQNGLLYDTDMQIDVSIMTSLDRYILSWSMDAAQVVGDQASCGAFSYRIASSYAVSLPSHISPTSSPSDLSVPVALDYSPGAYTFPGSSQTHSIDITVFHADYDPAAHVDYADLNIVHTFGITENDCSDKFLPPIDGQQAPIVVPTNTELVTTLTYLYNEAAVASWCTWDMNNFRKMRNVATGAIYSRLDLAWFVKQTPSSYNFDFTGLDHATYQWQGRWLFQIYGYMSQFPWTAETPGLSIDVSFCYVEKPSATFEPGQDKFVTTTEDHFFVDRSALDETLTVALTPYTLTDLAECGSLVYTIESAVYTATDDPNYIYNADDSLLSNVDNVLTFAGIRDYPVGNLIVTVSVRETIATEDAYDPIVFRVEIVECLAAEVTISNQVAVSSRYRRWGGSLWPEKTTNWQVQLYDFGVLAPYCSIDDTKISCTDPQGDEFSRQANNGAEITITSSQLCQDLISIDIDGIRVQIKGEQLTSDYGYTEQAAHEGAYTIRYQPLHESGSSYNQLTSQFTDHFRIDCAILTISPPSASQTFTIDPPVDSPDFGSATFTTTNRIFYWMRSQKEFALADGFSNPHPYSCSMQVDLYQVDQNGALIEPDTKFGISLKTQSQPSDSPTIVLNQPTNMPVTNQVNNMKIQASLVVGGQTQASADYDFELFLFKDCREDSSALRVASSNLDILHFRIGVNSARKGLIMNPPVYTTAFSESGACDIESVLVTDEEASDISAVYRVYGGAGNPYVMAYALSNTDVRTDPSDGSGPCYLQKLGQETCTVNYLHVAQSQNGTVATQNTGTVLFHSECLCLETIYATNQSPALFKSSTNKNAYDPGLQAGYEIRDDPLTFDLPYFQPSLPSGDDVIDMCGSMLYTVRLSSNKSKPEDVISWTLYPNDVYTSATVVVDVPPNEQSYALHDGLQNGSYMTQYVFSVEATLETYPALLSFATEASFYIRDYCFAVTYSQVEPLVQVTEGRLLIEEVLGDPWAFQMSKYLRSPPDTVMMEGVNYQKYMSSEWNVGCGALSYEVTEKSWVPSLMTPEQADGWSDLPFKMLTGNSFEIGMPLYFEFGAHDYIWVGFWTVTIKIKPQEVILSLYEELSFEIQIEGCFIEHINTHPSQTYANIDLLLGFESNVPFMPYLQEPDCEKPITYEVHLIEQTYDSYLIPETFDRIVGGQQPQPPFVTLETGVDQDFLSLDFLPLDSSLLGSTYAVFVYATISTNNTIQADIAAYHESFMVTVPLPKYNNRAPSVSGQQLSLELLVDEEASVTVGFPFDINEDDFYLTEWGFKGVQKGSEPDWITFDNSTITEGIIFNFEPPSSAEGLSLSIWYTLRDLNRGGPKESKFQFEVRFSLPDEVEQVHFFTPAKDKQVDRKIILVEITAPNQDGLFDVTFSDEIRLPGNCTKWSNLNEGAQTLQLNYIPSLATQTLLYDMDTSIGLGWGVVGIGQTEEDEVMVQTGVENGAETGADASGRRRRRLQAEASDSESGSTEDQASLLKVRSLNLKANFTFPDLVSRSSRDQIEIKVQQEMFALEPTFDFEYYNQEYNQDNYQQLHELPQQAVSEDYLSAVQQFTDSTENALKAFFSANVVLSFFSAGLLQYLWGMVNTLQMVVLTVLFRLDHPVNSDMFMTMILKLCALDFIEIDWAFELLFDFRETEAFFTTELVADGEVKSKFAEAGFSSANYFELLGPIFFIVLLYAILFVLKLIAVKAVSCCGDNCLTNKVRSKPHWSLITIRFLLEGCLEIGLSAMICTLMIDDKTFSGNNKWEVVSTISAFVSLFGLLVAPIWLLRVTRAYLAEVGAAEKGQPVESRYSKLFEDYRSNKSALKYPTLFFLRRYLMILVLTTMPGFKYAQIMSQITATVYMASFIASKKPYSRPQTNRQELINEVSVWMAAYPLFCFTNWVWDMDRRLEAGWVLISIICLNILYNMSCLVIEVCHSSKLMIKRWNSRRIGRKLRKKKAEEMRKAQEKEFREQEEAEQREKARLEQVYRMFIPGYAETEKLKQAQAGEGQVNDPIPLKVKGGVSTSGESGAPVNGLITTKLVHKKVNIPLKTPTTQNLLIDQVVSIEESKIQSKLEISQDDDFDAIPAAVNNYARQNSYEVGGTGNVNDAENYELDYSRSNLLGNIPVNVALSQPKPQPVTQPIAQSINNQDDLNKLIGKLSREERYDEIQAAIDDFNEITRGPRKGPSKGSTRDQSKGLQNTQSSAFGRLRETANATIDINAVKLARQEQQQAQAQGQSVMVGSRAAHQSVLPPQTVGPPLLYYGEKPPVQPSAAKRGKSAKKGKKAVRNAAAIQGNMHSNIQLEIGNLVREVVQAQVQIDKLRRF